MDKEISFTLVKSFELKNKVDLIMDGVGWGDMGTHFNSTGKLAPVSVQKLQTRHKVLQVFQNSNSKSNAQESSNGVTENANKNTRND